MGEEIERYGHKRKCGLRRKTKGMVRTEDWDGIRYYGFGRNWIRSYGIVNFRIGLVVSCHAVLCLYIYRVGSWGAARGQGGCVGRIRKVGIFPSLVFGFDQKRVLESTSISP